MEMNCAEKSFSRLSSLTESESVLVASESLHDTMPADGLVNLRVEKSSAEWAPRRNDEWEIGAVLTLPRTLVVCES